MPPRAPREDTTTSHPDVENTETEDATKHPIDETLLSPEKVLTQEDPADGEDGSDGGGFIDPKQTKKREQKIRWTDANQRRLLLFGFGRTVKKCEHKLIAESFREKPTEKSVQVFMTKKRGVLKKLAVEAGICKVKNETGVLRGIPRTATEAHEAAQDASFEKRPMIWTTKADCQLLTFGLGFTLTDTHTARIAPLVPGRPTRHSIRQRIAVLYEESRRLLEQHGIEVPAPDDGNPRQRQRVRLSETQVEENTSPLPPNNPLSSAPPPPHPPSPSRTSTAPPRPDLLSADEEPLPDFQERMRLARELNAARQALIDAEEERSRASRRVYAVEVALAEHAGRGPEDDGEEGSPELMEELLRLVEE